MNQILSTLAILLTTTVMLTAQHVHDSYCGTPPGRSEWLRTFQANPERFASRSDDWFIVPIRIHITGEDDGSGYTDQFSIGLAFKEMNVVFEPHKIQFYVIDDFNYIDNSEFHNHESFFTGIQMMNTHNEPNVVNMYVTANAAGACGYFSPGGDAVVVQTGCLQPEDHTMGHELGHFLSLPHTFSGWEGNTYNANGTTPEFISGRRVERVSGVNCDVAADGFCDTPPDYLSDRWSCGASGMSFEMKDPDGVPFNADGRYIMSYSTGDCRTLISEEQADAMRANIEFQRPDLNINEVGFRPLTNCGNIARISPPNNSDVESTSVTFVWENMGDVEYYRLELSQDFNFNSVETFETTDTFLVIDDLEPGDAYVWRVGGYAPQSPCMRTSGRNILRIAEATSSEEVDLQDLQVYASGRTLTIEVHHLSSELDLRVFDMAGRQMLLDRSSSGSRTIQYGLEHLSAGMYILRLHRDGEVMTKRIFVQ